MVRRTRRAVLGALAGVGLAGVAGCSAGETGPSGESPSGDSGGTADTSGGQPAGDRWPQEQFDGRNTGVAGDVTAPAGRPAAVWRYDVGGALWGAPAYRDGTLYLNRNGEFTRLRAIDRETGEKRWHMEYNRGNTGAPGSGDIWYLTPPAVSGQRLFIAYDHALDAWDLDVEGANYERAWEAEVGAVLYGTGPVVADGSVFMATMNRVTGWDASTGDRQLDRRFEGDEQFSHVRPAVADGELVTSLTALDPIQADAGRVVSVDIEAGTVRWSVPIEAKLLSPPTMGPTLAYVVSNDGVVSAVSRAAESVAWEHRLGGGFSIFHRPSVALADGLVIAADPAGAVVGLEATTGDVVWEVPTEGRPATAPVVVDATAYVTGGQRLHAIDINAGERRWSARRHAPTGNAGAMSVGPPVVADGVVYTVGRNTGAVHGFGGVDDEPRGRGVPKPQFTEVGVPREVPQGSALVADVAVRNIGSRAGQWSTITVGFPALDEQGDGDRVAILEEDFGDWSTVVAPGERITGRDGAQFPAEYVVAEAGLDAEGGDGWAAGATHRLRVQAQPASPGPFPVDIRATLTAPDAVSDRHTRPAPGLADATDQQGYPVRRIEVMVE